MQKHRTTRAKNDISAKDEEQAATNSWKNEGYGLFWARTVRGSVPTGDDREETGAGGHYSIQKKGKLKG